MPARTEVAYRILPVALADAAHLGLGAQDVAAILRRLMRDPTAGEATGKGRLRLGWHQFDVIYDVHLGADLITLYLFRIRDAGRRPGIAPRGGAAPEEAALREALGEGGDRR